MSEYKSYKSKVYDDLDTQITKKLGLPDGLLSSIRLNGERSNADQVSEAGARSVYQIIPSTRKSAIDKFGIDPYISPKNAAEVAGRLLKESLDRNKGDVHSAVSEYHGGTNKSNWGAKTKAYAERVVGSLIPSAQADEMSQQEAIDPNELAAATAWYAKQKSLSPIENESIDPAELAAAMDWYEKQNNHPHPTQEQLDAAKNHTFKDDLVQTLQENPLGAKLAAFADPVTSLYQGAKQLFGADNKQDIQNIETIREESPISALAGNVATYAVGGATAPVVNTLKGAAATGAVTGFINPTENNSIEERITHAGIGAGAGAVGVGVANKAGQYIAKSKADKALEQSLNATRDATLKESVDSGYVVTPSLANAGKTARAVEGLTGSYRMARSAMDTNQKVTNSLTNEYLGLPKGTALSSDVIESLKQPHNSVYEEVAQLPAIKASPGYLGTSKDITKDGSAVLQDLKETRFEAKDYHRHAELTGDPTSTKIARQLDAKAKGIEDQLELMAQKSGNKDLIGRFRNARKELAKVHTIDKVLNEATGDVDAIALGKLAKKGVPLDGPARKIALFGNAYSKLAKVPSDGNSAPFTAVDAGLMGGGAGAGNPLLAALPIGRVLGREAILSNPVQKSMANKSYSLSPIQQTIDSILTNKYAPFGISGGLLQESK